MIYLLAPFGLSTDDVVIDHDLSGVGKITKLGFPHHQVVRIGDVVPVLETQDPVLTQMTVSHNELVLFAGHRVNGFDGLPSVLVMHHCVSMTESASFHVLTG